MVTLCSTFLIASKRAASASRHFSCRFYSTAICSVNIGRICEAKRRLGSGFIDDGGSAVKVVPASLRLEGSVVGGGISGWGCIRCEGTAVSDAGVGRP